jgi:hypothetical protein
MQSRCTQFSILVRQMKSLFRPEPPVPARLLRALLFLVACATCVPALAQTTVTLMDGLNSYGGTTDARIAAASPTANAGTATTYFLRGETHSAVLARFAIFAADGGPVPDNATITSATLSFYKYWGAAATIKASRLKRSWSESQVTWNQAATGTAWQTAGALGANDVESAADGQATVGDGAANDCLNGAAAPAACWLNIDVTSGVQAFRNGTANHGWKLIYVTGGDPNDDKEFNSRDNDGWPTLRPKLTVTYTTGCTGPFGGSAWGVGEIEAENFDCGGEGVGYHDTTPGNQQGSTYRPNESVDVWDIPAGGRTVRDFNTGEWMAYTIDVPAGSYNLAISAAHNATPGQYRIEIDGTDVTGNVSVPGTGSWDVYQWVQAPSAVTLAAGTHVLRVVSALEAFRVDKIRLESAIPPGSCEDPPQRPFAGTIQVPAGGAEFEAENFDCGGEGTAYHDTTTGNQLGTFRAEESVDVWDIPTGGRVVRNFDTGEWMEYTINIAQAGSYRLGIQAGHNATPGSYRIEVDGTDATGSVAVPSTGSWDVYQWFDAQTPVTLTQGTHVLRLFSVQQHFRVEKLRVIPEDGPIDPADLLARPRADIDFAGQPGSIQVLAHMTMPDGMGASRLLDDVPETGLHSGNTSYGTLRFGKQADPADSSKQVFAFTVAPGDPITNSGKRAELTGFGENIEFGKTYWAAVKVYVYSWGSAGNNSHALFGMQVHAGNGAPGGLSPSFGIYTQVTSADPQKFLGFRIPARYATCQSGTCDDDKVWFPPESQPARTIPFGQWVEFVFKFRHGAGTNGLLQVWQDRVQIVNYENQGALGYANSGVNDYIKFGYYNWEETIFDNSGQARKVLLRSPLLIRGFDATTNAPKYTVQDVWTFLDQQQ